MKTKHMTFLAVLLCSALLLAPALAVASELPMSTITKVGASGQRYSWSPGSC